MLFDLYSQNKFLEMLKELFKQIFSKKEFKKSSEEKKESDKIQFVSPSLKEKEKEFYEDLENDR